MKKSQFSFLIFLFAFFQLVVASPSFGLSVVNLNTASEAELEALPGVGPKLAKEIVAARPLHSVDDLKQVKGIGAAKFKKLQSLVTADAPNSAPAAAVTSVPAGTTASAPAPVAAQVTSANKPVAETSPVVGEKININSATLEELDRLPGIGKVKAQAIINGRPYQNVDDLMKVKGIKGKTLAKIKDHVTVN